MENLPFDTIPKHHSFEFAKFKKFIYFLVGVVAFLILYFLLITPPSGFAPNTLVKIDEGATLRDVSFLLKKENVIRSRFMFEALVVLYGGESRIVAGNHLFEKKVSVFAVASQISRGTRYTASIVVVIPEGFDALEIADTFSKKLKNFKKENFLNYAKEKEGYFFRDTYYFSDNDNEHDVIASMTRNFNKKMAPIRPRILSLGKDEKDIITMASIIERESKGDSDRALISGILWKRISISMPLQVDAAPQTYKNRGLPARPISNPGMESILAAMYPENSAYLYYLHEKNGTIHYAKTFEEHRKNIDIYLK